MKALVVYFTRTGLTELVAEKIASRLGADLLRLKEEDEYKGALGYVRAGRKAMKKEKVKLLPFDVKPREYDLVIIGSPVWAFTMAPAIRSFLINYVEQCKNIAFFQTMGGEHEQKCFTHMKKIAGTPLATLAVRSRLIKKEEYIPSLNNFIKKVNRVK